MLPLHMLLNGLLTLSLHPMERFLHPCPKAIQAANRKFQQALSSEPLRGEVFAFEHSEARSPSLHNVGYPRSSHILPYL